MNLSRSLLTAFGLGFLRPAPGTWGSLPPVALVLGLLAAGASPALVNGALAVVAIAFAVTCLRFGREAESWRGRKDPSEVVADEVSGQCLALLALPWREGDWRWNLALAATSFLAFRAMDVVKPLPARQLQRLDAGAGILIDDIVAGAYALLAVQVLARFALPGLLR